MTGSEAHATTRSAKSEVARRGLPGWAWDKLAPWLGHPQLAPRLALVAIVLSSSALFLSFYLDDFIGRYIYSDLEGAARLYRNYSGGYGLAIGDAAENHWQMEAGWAPWWHYDELRIALFRPIGVLFHTLDFTLWPNNAFLMHAHNLLWLGALVAAMTWLYRGALGGLVGGAAALLFAFDHTHGFAVGHICNRHALMGPMFGALCLGFHIRSRRTDNAHGTRDALLALAFYALGLLTSESSLAVAGYVIAYELLADGATWKKRAIAVAPFLAMTVIWRGLYNKAGYGAFGSGVYTDMGREPLQYAKALIERGPILWLGQFLSPPAETFGVLPDDLAKGMWIWALVVVALTIWALFPLLRRDRMARFWFVGMVGSLVPAAAVLPHNRQLVFASIGAMALLAQLWRYYAEEVDGQLVVGRSASRAFGILLLAAHLIGSPLSLPASTASVALTKPMHTLAASIGDEVAGKDLVFVTTPDHYTVRMVQLMKRLNGSPLPAHIRALSGVPSEVPEPLTVKRTGPNTLEVHYEGGLFHAPDSDLHRDRSLPMPAGTQVHLEGFDVEVVKATAEGWPEDVRFTFDKPLEDPRMAFYQWQGASFVPFTAPAIGQSTTLLPSKTTMGL